MDSDLRREILTVTLSSSNEERTSVARLYSYKDNAVNLIGNACLDSSVSSFAAINYDRPVGDRPAIVYIDAYVSQTDMITEVLFWDENSEFFRLRLITKLQEKTMQYGAILQF